MVSPHKPETASFIVDTAQGLTALHLCALVPDGLTLASGEPIKSSDFDKNTNRFINHKILECYGETKHLNWKCYLQGKTALHLAAENGKVDVVEELVNVGAKNVF